MRWFEKFQTGIVMLAILIGFTIGQIAWIAEHATFFIMPFLLLMLYGVFLQTPLTDLGTALHNRKVVGASLVLNFAWNPVLAWALGALFLREAPDLWVGFIMLMVTPCTDWYLIFTSIARGNVALATSLLPINLILQIVLLPVYIFVFAGTLVQIEPGVLITSVLMVLVVPMLLALATRRLIIQRKGTQWFETMLLPRIPGSQTLFLSLVIASMFASQGTAMLDNLHVFLILLIPLALFYVLNFSLTQVTSRFFHLSYEDNACLTCTTLARNSPTALAIALTAFPDRPLIALALVIGPLFELPILGLVSQALLVIRRRSIQLNQ